MSRVDEAYVALRDLIKARFVSRQTRESALRAVEKVQQEAITEIILKPSAPEERKAIVEPSRTQESKAEKKEPPLVA